MELVEIQKKIKKVQDKDRYEAHQRCDVHRRLPRYGVRL